jgi:hypothetical protein
VRWRLSNAGERSIRILTAVQPHARFRNEERPLDLELGIGSGTELVLPVTFDEPAGAVVENPFLILRVSDAGGEWRVLARLRVAAGDRGEPRVNMEAVTTQRVGLAEQPEDGAI